MIDYSLQIQAADRLADCVDRVLREKVTMAELATLLLEYRAAQVLLDEELSEAFAKLQEQLEPIVDYEKKKLYHVDTLKHIAKDSKERS